MRQLRRYWFRNPLTSKMKAVKRIKYIPIPVHDNFVIECVEMLDENLALHSFNFNGIYFPLILNINDSQTITKRLMASSMLLAGKRGK